MLWGVWEKRGDTPVGPTLVVMIIVQMVTAVLIVGFVEFRKVDRETASPSSDWSFVYDHNIKMYLTAPHLSASQDKHNQDMPSAQATRHERQRALALLLDIFSAQQAVGVVG
jgi:hypothetical protein